MGDPQSWLKRRLLELYWTITRFVGLAHLHDGSSAQYTLRRGRRDRGGLALPNEDSRVNLLHERLVAASGKKRNSSCAGSQPRLAFISPLPPQKTGVADYGLDIATALAADFVIDYIVEKPVEVDVHGLEGGVYDPAWFEAHAFDYDVVLYQVGNSAFHGFMLSLIKKYPGIVVLHDFFLLNLVERVAMKSGASEMIYQFIYESHGYPALVDFCRNEDFYIAAEKYPGNFFLVNQAQALVAHNDYARQLSRHFYGVEGFERTYLAPLPRRAAQIDRATRLDVRRRHDISDDAFVVCSFGSLDSRKQCIQIIAAWAHSDVGKRPVARLVFVGGVDPAYQFQIDEVMRETGLTNVIFTGYADRAEYADFLNAADIAIQLRVNSRGETSGALLDVMSYGLPTIANDHGASAGLPENVVLKIGEACAVDEIRTAIDALASDGKLRKFYEDAARNHVETHHSLTATARAYAAIFDAVGLQKNAIADRNLLFEAANNPAKNADGLLDEARRLAALSRLPRPAKRLFVDVSAMARARLHSGIQRVVRAQISGLLTAAPPNYRVEPVWLSDDPDGQWRLRFARDYICEFLELPEGLLTDDVVDFAEGDIYFGADYFAHGVTGADRGGLFAEMREGGVHLHFTVYDNLPVQYPHFFPPGADRNHTAWLRAVASNADQLICISDAVKQSVTTWLGSVEGVGRPKLSALHLGADADPITSTKGMPANVETIFAMLDSRPTFLMVGTIEPRKGYLATLDAFEKLWSNGVDVNLVIVGAQGWKSEPKSATRTIPETIERMRECREGGRRFHWLSNASDELLERLYERADCLIAASEDEGFGLPLIEAARHGVPLLVRDIPVFREVAGDCAFYFSASGADLDAAVRCWLALYEIDEHPSSKELKWLTWAEHVERLMDLLDIERQDRPQAPAPCRGDA